MSRCCTREELTHFLADELSAEEQYSLVAHLESCVACLQALENLLDADPEPGAFLPQAWRSRMPPTRPDFLERLKALSPGSTLGRRPRTRCASVTVATVPPRP